MHRRYPDRPPARAFGPLSHPSGITFFAAMASVLFSTAIPLIECEIMGEMKDPRQFPKALLISTLVCFTIYLFGGIFTPVLWGRNVAIPIGIPPTMCGDIACPDSPAGLLPGWPAIVVNVSLAVASSLDYVILAVVLHSRLTLNLVRCCGKAPLPVDVVSPTNEKRWRSSCPPEVVVRKLFPSFDYRYSLRNAGRWFLVTAPGQLLILALAILVPDLSSLVGLVTTYSLGATSSCVGCTSVARP